MASTVREPNGRRLIQLSRSEDPARPKIRLGKVTKRDADTARVHVENLIRSKVTGGVYPPATAEWLAGVPEMLRRRLENVGLVAPQKRRACPTLAEWARGYIEGRSDVKPNTRRNLEQAENSLVGFLGTAKTLDEITQGDAEDYRIHLKAQGLSEGTIRRRCKRAKQFLTAAVKKKVISENPFAELKCGNYANADRFYFVSRGEAEAVLDACPDAEWRLIFALCRYGGTRCPTEVLRLTWADIDWARMRFTVHASKTEHQADGGIRQVPIFPELYPYLRDRFERAEPGTEFVITRYRDANANLRTHLKRIIKRAGLTIWPKLFQNLRSTRETELAQEFPIHVVCKWLGNSSQVASKHYLQVTEDHFAKAVQNPVQQAAALARTAPRAKGTDEGELCVCSSLRDDAAPREGREPHRIPPRGIEPLSPG